MALAEGGCAEVPLPEGTADGKGGKGTSQWRSLTSTTARG